MKLPKSCMRLLAPAAMALILMVATIHDARASAEQQNIVQLIASSQSIVAGTVTKVSDGIDANGLPYTEVTIAVGVSPKGKIGHGDYTFRQFGLLKPRKLPNGHTLLMVTPAEFPRWHENEYVVAFLYHPAAKTGLQTTAGLAQGKLVMVNNKLANQFENAGLFDNVKIAPGVLPAAEQKLFGSRGPVEGETLLGLINHIVQGQLIEKGKIK
ncbi:MAG TPA: hypothetical protein VIC31_06235 [Rudaea sp.]